MNLDIVISLVITIGYVMEASIEKSHYNHGFSAEWGLS